MVVEKEEMKFSTPLITVQLTLPDNRHSTLININKSNCFWKYYSKCTFQRYLSLFQ